jgi:hypothetical protein
MILTSLINIFSLVCCSVRLPVWCAFQTHIICKIWYSDGNENKDYHLLGCDAVSSDEVRQSFLGTYCLHLQSGRVSRASKQSALSDPHEPEKHWSHIRVSPRVLRDGCFHYVWPRALLTARNMGVASLQACKAVRTVPAGWSHRKTQQTPYVDILPAVEVPMEGPGSKGFKPVQNSADPY